MIKGILKIISTNWIHLVGFYITTYLTLVIGEIFNPTEGWEPIIVTGFLAAFMLFALYGYAIIGWFYLAILIMDMAAFGWKSRWTKEILIVEWVIISAPFVYWAFKYEYWLWLALSMSLLATQMLRKRSIDIVRGSTSVDK